MYGPSAKTGCRCRKVAVVKSWPLVRGLTVCVCLCGFLKNYTN